MEEQEKNSLEKILKLAANEPAHRPEFFRVLLESTVYVLGSAGSAKGITHLAAGSKVEISHWEKPDGALAVSFFSSLEVLRKAIETEQSYLALPARSLFEITLGKNIFLNPGSLYGKEFSPEEVQQILSHGVTRKPIQRIVEKETKVQIGQPANYPLKMVKSLAQLFAKHLHVKRAFVALMYEPGADEKPHLVVGIEADGDFELVLREAGNVAADTSPDGAPVDLFRVNKDDTGLSSYFLYQATPFYERRWSVKLRSLFRIDIASRL